MTAPRKPRPDTITRAEAEEMVRAAVAAERERSERPAPLRIRTAPMWSKK